MTDNTTNWYCPGCGVVLNSQRAQTHKCRNHQTAKGEGVSEELKYLITQIKRYSDRPLDEIAELVSINFEEMTLAVEKRGFEAARIGIACEEDDNECRLVPGLKFKFKDWQDYEARKK